MTAMMTNTHPSLRRFWHPVALESDVPEGRPVPVRLLGEAWLLARLGGQLVAMRDRCPHRLVPLSAGTIVGDELQCGYHGYRFDATGRATAIPALPPSLPIPTKACVATAAVAVRFGLVWLCLSDEPVGGILDDAPFHNPGNDTFLAGPFTTRVSAGILADNFLDCAHFPYLHRDTFGEADDGRPILDVRRDGWRIYQDQDQMIAGVHLDAPQAHQARYVVGAPFSVELALHRPDGTDWIWSFVCPVDDQTSVWYIVDAYPLGGDQELIAAAQRLQAQVGIEDLGMLERMEDPNIPIDVRAEVHTKADIGCLEYRRMLADVASLGKRGLAANASVAPSSPDSTPAATPVATGEAPVNPAPMLVRP
jgi:phenylpropionate dioxygenase-like ring-hydroxylating dioxygenase large terminal subunit